MGVGIIGVIIQIFIGNLVENKREACREIREEFIGQRSRETEEEVTEKFVKAAHGFGVEANFEMEFAVCIVVKSAG